MCGILARLGILLLCARIASSVRGATAPRLRQQHKGPGHGADVRHVVIVGNGYTRLLLRERGDASLRAARLGRVVLPLAASPVLVTAGVEGWRRGYWRANGCSASCR